MLRCSRRRAAIQDCNWCFAVQRITRAASKLTNLGHLKMTTVARALTSVFFNPFAGLLTGAKSTWSNGPVPCWTEYLREQNRR
jgi:hypothetical protein